MAVGLDVEVTVGLDVGDFVGLLVGASVGLLVGSLVGDFVGLLVGSSVGGVSPPVPGEGGLVLGSGVGDSVRGPGGLVGSGSSVRPSSGSQIETVVVKNKVVVRRVE